MRPESERLDVGHDAAPHLWERPGARSIGSVLVTAATLAAAGFGTAELLADHSDPRRRPAVSTAQPVPPDNVMALRVQRMNGFRLVGFGAVSLIVPSYWGRNEVTDCGVPYSDTVLYPARSRQTRSCASVMSGRHSYVAFEDRRCPASARRHPDDELTRRLGQPVRTSGIQRQHAMYEVRVELGTSATCIEMSSPYRAVVERLLGTVRVRSTG